MKNTMLFLVISVFIIQGCLNPEQNLNNESNVNVDYLDYSNRDDQFTGGIKMIPISTP